MAESVPPDSTGKTIARAWPVLVLLAPFATAYAVRLELRAHDAEVAATVAGNRASQAETAVVEAEKRFQERMCQLETAHVAALSDAVSLAAADAEPDKRRKADTARAARAAFDGASKRWACWLPGSPSSEHTAERLQEVAKSALEVRPR